MDFLPASVGKSLPLLLRACGVTAYLMLLGYPDEDRRRERLLGVQDSGLRAFIPYTEL